MTMSIRKLFFVTIVAVHVNSAKSVTSNVNDLMSPYTTYECEAPLGPLQDWYPDTSGKLVCYNNLHTCCGPLINISSCSDSEDPMPGKWTNGVCSGYSAKDCCFIDNGFEPLTISACDAPQEKILVNWDGDTCTANSLSKCCGIRKDFTSCTGSSQQVPGLWNNGVCSGFSELECCFEDYLPRNFIACYENQKKIEGQWGDGDCYATFPECCQTMDTGGTTTASNSNVGIALGVTFGVLFVIAVVAVCFRHRSCPLHGKMNGSGSNPPHSSSLASTEENKPATVSGDDSGGATESSTSTVHQQISSVLNATESVTGIINNVAQISSLARGDPSRGTENV